MTVKNLWRTLLMVLCSASLITACGDDDNNPFVGMDNNVLSFSLSKGENTWQASIADNEIVITVPEGTELTGSTVAYHLSEQAGISPDPAGITQWNEEQQFVVTSYNQTPRTYKYTVQYVAISETANIVLNSQADVDAFAQRGVNIIEGSLHIGFQANEDDPITNLNGLSKLTEIVDELRIGSYYKGENLKGLDKIKKAGSILITITNRDIAENLNDVSFPSLTFIRKDLQIFNGDNVETISIPLLETILGSSEIRARGAISFNMNSLKKVGGSIVFDGNLLDQMEFPSLEYVGNEYRLYKFSTEFSNLKAVNLPALVNCPAIRIENAEKLETLRIPMLRNMDLLSFGSCPSFDDIDTVIKDMESIASIRLTSTNVLELDASSKGIEELIITPIGTTQFTLTGNETFGNIEFANIDQAPLPILNGINTLDNYSIKTERSFISLDGIKKITGSLTISATRFGVLDELVLPDLESVGNLKSHLGSSSISISLKAPKLTTVTGNLDLTVYTDQPDLSYIVLPELTTVGGALNISGKLNSQQNITQIDCFPKLSSVKDIDIRGFRQLYDFSPFKSLIDHVNLWTVRNCGFNPTLQQMKDSPTGDFSNN
ncbi:receptor [Proteiniphilum sp. UBA5384]|uniref:receptor n=1 Tax=Proteiniphilum sp. UBA5384 TaxID=1947279 RepID=UPI0025E41921|nr:receptor [Proteiniphilum sp. UBA5384]